MTTAAQASQYDLSLHDHANLEQRNGQSAVVTEDRLCPGCKLPAVNETGGLVVAFGQSFFHVDCFKCAKCNNQVTADTNLLLLSDGSPICANCSYNCNVCQLPILDEAIMTGDDSYHAHCFKCKVCRNRIDELVFAKTSQGIYCMNCHNERMIKIRRHAQKKAEREKAAGGSSASTKSRERAARQHHAQNERMTNGFTGRQSPASPYSGPQYSGNGVAASYLRSDMSPTAASQSPSALSFPQVSVDPPRHSASSPTTQTPRPGQKVAPRLQNQSTTLSASSVNSSVSNGSLKGRKSYDDGVRPLNVLMKQAPDANSDAVHVNQGLTVTSRAEKRRSINPGLTLSPVPPVATVRTSSPTLSPIAAQFQGQSATSRSPTPPSRGGRDSPRAPSPLREFFAAEAASSRPTSDGSVQSVASQFYSTPSTPDELVGDQDGDPTIRPRAISTSTYTSGYTQTPITRPPLRTIVSADGAAPNSASMRSPLVPSPLNGCFPHRSSPGPSQVDMHLANERRPERLSSTSLSVDRRRSRSPSQPPMSPRHKPEVPRGVESGTDTEAESGDDSPTLPLDDGDDMPPVPPPKSPRPDKDRSVPGEISVTLANEFDPDASGASEPGSGSDFSENLESPAEQRTSQATFIAPALPPIRFSMTSGDFSSLFNSVGGTHGSHAMEHLVKLTESSKEDGPLTPPPTASTNRGSLTPTTGTTFVDTPSTATLATTAENGFAGRTRTISNESIVPNGVQRNDSNGSMYSHERQNSSGKSSTASTHSGLARSLSTSAAQHPSASFRRQNDSPHRLADANGASTLRRDNSDVVVVSLREALADATERGKEELRLDKNFCSAILNALESRQAECAALRSRFDGVKRESKQYIAGLTVAQTEYDRELKARRDAEAEVTRLRVLLSGQAARLTLLSGDSKRQELREQLSKQLDSDLSGLEQDLSKLRVERDMTIAECEELKAAPKNLGEAQPAELSRRLTVRLDTLRSQYERELVPLTQQKEALAREVAELKAVRDVFLEETTVLNARNEELAQLSSQYARRMETVPEVPTKSNGIVIPERGSSLDRSRPPLSTYFPQTLASSLSSSTASTYTSDDTADLRSLKAHQSQTDTPLSKKFMKWTASKAKEPSLNGTSSSDNITRTRSQTEHSFQQLSVLRFTRCDHCGDKMWGSQLRCTGCSVSVHVRCVNHVNTVCNQQSLSRDESPVTYMPPSMFGRDLIEQVRADYPAGDHHIPVIVEKCIDAVEVHALEYEGIYRKTGGSSQCKIITQLFERGDYKSFDLRDDDRFNDICSITSVLKTYFRTLPDPLLTYDLHEQFMSAIQLRDQSEKNRAMRDLVNTLPLEHYCTLRLLMIHLYHILERSDTNLMSARNLGVVFGPTLMRSRDPGAEFSDMAGKALSVEWLIENVPHVFSPTSTPS